MIKHHLWLPHLSWASRTHHLHVSIIMMQLPEFLQHNRNSQILNLTAFLTNPSHNNRNIIYDYPIWAGLPRLIISTSSSSWCNCQKNRQNFCNVAEIPRFSRQRAALALPSYGRRYFQIPPYKLVNFKMRLLTFYFLVKSAVLLVVVSREGI